MDRDHNVAINIKRRGERMRKLEQATAGTAGSSGSVALPVNARGEGAPTEKGNFIGKSPRGSEKLCLSILSGQGGSPREGILRLMSFLGERSPWP
jgi:hypothetical protein